MVVLLVQLQAEVAGESTGRRWQGGARDLSSRGEGVHDHMWDAVHSAGTRGEWGGGWR